MTPHRFLLWLAPLAAGYCFAAMIVEACLGSYSLALIMAYCTLLNCLCWQYARQAENLRKYLDDMEKKPWE